MREASRNISAWICMARSHTGSRLAVASSANSSRPPPPRAGASSRALARKASISLPDERRRDLPFPVIVGRIGDDWRRAPTDGWRSGLRLAQPIVTVGRARGRSPSSWSVPGQRPADDLAGVARQAGSTGDALQALAHGVPPRRGKAPPGIERAGEAGGDLGIDLVERQYLPGDEVVTRTVAGVEPGRVGVAEGADHGAHLVGVGGRVCRVLDQLAKTLDAAERRR